MKTNRGTGDHVIKQPLYATCHRHLRVSVMFTDIKWFYLLSTNGNSNYFGPDILHVLLVNAYFLHAEKAVGTVLTTRISNFGKLKTAQRR